MILIYADGAVYWLDRRALYDPFPTPAGNENLSSSAAFYQIEDEEKYLPSLQSEREEAQ